MGGDMTPLHVNKIIGGLPRTLEPNQFYAVRVGEGYDLFLTDETGQTAHKLNTSANAVIKKYFINYRDNVVVNGNNKVKRAYIEQNLLTKEVKFHFDFSLQHLRNNNIAELSSFVPPPRSLFETQLYDGATLWIEPNHRDMIIGGAVADRRYIINGRYYYN